jgi:hypothetical protein
VPCDGGERRDREHGDHERHWEQHDAFHPARVVQTADEETRHRESGAGNDLREKWTKVCRRLGRRPNPARGLNWVQAAGAWESVHRHKELAARHNYRLSGIHFHPGGL